MNTSNKLVFKQKFTNFFGGLGYISCTLQWLWAILLYASYIFGIITFLTPAPSPQVVEVLPVTSQTTSPLILVIGAIVTVTAVVLTVFIIIKMPSTIAKTSQKFVRKSAESMAPSLLHIQKKKDTKRNKIKLTYGLVLTIKIILMIIPVVLSYTSRFIEYQSLDSFIAIYVGLFLAGISLVFFGIQYILIKLLLINKQDVC